MGVVHDGEHLLQVRGEKRIEEHLVPILEGSQKLILRQIGTNLRIRTILTIELLLECRDLRREEPFEAQHGAFLFSERGATIEQR